MRTVIALFVFLLVCRAFTVYKDIPRYFSLGIPFAQNRITINGYLDDWGDLSGFRSLVFRDSASNRPGRFGNEMVFSLQWDLEFLYVGCFVRDAHLNAASRSDLDNVRQDDAVQLFFDTRNDSGSHMNDDDYHLIIGLNNNVNELRGSSERRRMGETVPRVSSRDLDYKLYVRPFGTVNDNGDLDSGFVVEMALRWKSLCIDPLKQRFIRMDLGNIDLDTSDFSNPGIWQNEYYSEYIYGDRSFAKSPSAWPVIELRPPSNPLPDQGKTNLWVWAASALVLVLAVTGMTVYYRRIRAINETINNQILVRLQQYLHEHYRQKVSLEDFCKLHNYQENRVQRIIKARYGGTFANVVLQKRMEEAKLLLETTDKNVTEVCFEVGFNDASYFTKSFKVFFNMLPKDIKKKRPVA